MSTIEMVDSERSGTETCPSCGAAMAGDQRYCLSCGGRRGEPRLPFTKVTARAAVAPPPPPEQPPPSHAAVPITWPVAGAAAALVVLALGVGVLIGNSTSKAPKVSQATPQVVTVAGGGTTGASGAAAQDASSGAAAKHHKSSKSSHAKAASDKGSVTVDKQQLNNLDNLSPQQYQKQSSKLPDTIKTQGKAAPIDKSKPVGGGSGSQTFK